MVVWVIIKDCCGEFVSVWSSKEGAEAETARLNREYVKRSGRENYSYEEDTLG